MDYQENVMMAKPDKSNTLGMGVASMVLGILSLVLFCSCCNIILSVLAIVFGFVQICTKTNKNGKVFAWVGVGCGIAAVVCTVVFWVLCLSEGSIYSRSYNQDSDEFMKEYQEFLNDLYKDDPVMQDFYNQYYQNNQDNQNKQDDKKLDNTL